MQCLQTKLEPITYATTTPMYKKTSFLNGTKIQELTFGDSNYDSPTKKQESKPKTQKENNTKPCVKKLA